MGPVDDDGFEHELAAGAEVVSQFVEVVDGGTAVVEYPHAEYGVEGGQGGRQAFDAEGEDPDGGLGQVLSDGEVLHDVEQEGIGAEGELGACSGHAPAVVAAAAADVEDEAVFEVGDAGEEAVPFEVGAPLGVDVGAEEVEGAFSPGAELVEGVGEVGGLGCIQILGLADLDGGGGEGRVKGEGFLLRQGSGGRGRVNWGGEGFDGGEPFVEVAVVGVEDGGGDGGAEGIDPGSQVGVGEEVVEGIVGGEW